LQDPFFFISTTLIDCKKRRKRCLSSKIEDVLAESFIKSLALIPERRRILFLIKTTTFDIRVLKIKDLSKKTKIKGSTLFHLLYEESALFFFLYGLLV
jgi:hypothetical protein